MVSLVTPSSFKRLFVGDDDSYAGVVPADDLLHVAGPYGPVFRVSSTAAVDTVTIGALTVTSAGIANIGTGGRFTISQDRGWSAADTNPPFRVNINSFGTVSGMSFAQHSFNNRDNIAASLGSNVLYMAHNYGGSTFNGSRTSVWMDTYTAADSTATTFAANQFVTHAPWHRVRHWLGGIPGAERPAIWGSNPLAYAGTGSGTIGGRGLKGILGEEVNFGSVYNCLRRSGLDIIEWAGDDSSAPGIGYYLDTGITMSRMPDKGLPGVDFGIAFGHSFAQWPIKAVGTVIGVLDSLSSVTALTRVAAFGLDIRRVTYTAAAIATPGLTVDGSGNLGSNAVASGNVLQTASTVVAKTTSVASITVLDGGRYSVFPTLTLDAPPSGVTATATVATMQAREARDIVTGQGTGYVVNDVLTLSGGTFATAAQYTVDAVTATGAIIALTLTTAGNYTVLPSVLGTLTGGAGTGAKVTPFWSIRTVTVAAAGSGYNQYAPPAIDISGTTSYARAVLQVVMTAGTQVPLSLNPGGSVLIGTQTPASASATGTTGTVAWNASFIYVCTATNTWARVGIATW